MPMQKAPPDLAVSRLATDDGEAVVFSWTPEAQPRRRPESAFTPAERAVYALLLLGLGDAEIASFRETTRSTITKQVDAIFRKIGVRSRRELIAHHSTQRA